MIVQRLRELDETRIFDPKRTKESSGLTQELQTEINTWLLEPIGSFEHDDYTALAKPALPMEKR